MTQPSTGSLRALFLATSVVFGATGTSAQTTRTEEAQAWQESAVEPPSQPNLDKVVTFELDRSSSLRFGIDPDTLKLGADGVVRYVFVARSNSGALNVLYEGIRCQTDEVKLYALWDADTGWTPASSNAWTPLSFRGPARRATQMARGGICFNGLPNGQPRKMLDALRNGTTDLLR